MKTEFVTRIDVISGYLGAGKSTWLRRYVEQDLHGERIFIFLNEYGEEKLDTLQEMTDNEVTFADLSGGGCVCCSGKGDFREAMAKKIAWESPDRIVVETAGAAMLSEVLKSLDAVRVMGKRNGDEIITDHIITVINAKKFRLYSKNLGEFYRDQIRHAKDLVLTHTDGMDEEKLRGMIGRLREMNPGAQIVRAA